MSEPRLINRIATGALWSHGAHIVGMAVVFGGLAVLARVLTPHDFGLFGMAFTAVTFLEVVRSFGLQSALIYFGKSDLEDSVFDAGFFLTLAVGALLTFGLLLLAPVAGSFYGNEQVTSLMQALSVYFLIGGFGAVPDAILRQRLDFRRRFWSEIAAPVGRYGVSIALAAAGFGVWSLVLGQLAGILLQVMTALVLAAWVPSFRFRPRTAQKLLVYGSLAGVVDLLAAFALNLDYILVGRFLGSSPLGIYTLAFKIPDMTIVAVAWVVGNLLLPAYVHIGESREELRDAFLHTLHFLGLVLTPAAVGIMVLAPVLVPFLFGEQWLSAVPVLQLMAISCFVRGMIFNVGTALMACGRPGLLIGAQVVWLIVLIPSLYLTAQIGISAVAAAHIAGVLVYAVVKLRLLSRVLSFRFRDLLRPVIPGFMAAAVMALVLLGWLQMSQDLPTGARAMAGVLVGMSVYTAAVWIFDAPAVRQVRAIAGPMLGKA